MTALTVGVIGHVNHGKTALVGALTGIETDRLAEEKRRGMSIVLGFAYLPLEDGVLDLVDVPGHEQFIRTMVAGAAGIGASLLVVDAREGIKPQTLEHLQIAELLGLRRGVVALTKCDLADPPRLEAVRRELRALLRGTHLEFAPMVATSARSGTGLDALRESLAALMREHEPPDAAGTAFCLPIDRVFSLPGQGTVVTGTLRGGILRVGDALVCMPRGLAGSVRQLQVHNTRVGEALPGQRVGANLRQLRTQDLARGDVLAPPGALQPAQWLDVELRLAGAADEPQLIEGRRLRLLLGGTEAVAVPRLLAREGGRWLAQLRTLRPVVASVGEAFILRRDSPAATLGGGRVLQASARRTARADANALERMRLLAGGSGPQRLQARLQAAGRAGLPLTELAAGARLSLDGCAQALQQVAVVHEQRAWHVPLVQQLQARLVEAVARHHAAHPLRAGMPLAECRAALPGDVGDALWRRLLQALESEGRLLRRGASACLPRHDPLQALDATARAELQALAQAFRMGGMCPPDAPSAEREPQRRTLLELLVAQGEILLLPGQPPSQRVAFHRDALACAHQRLAQAWPPPKGFTVSQARELLGSTRKFTVPLLEYLHASGHTRRRGDLHLFKEAGEGVQGDVGVSRSG